MLPILLRPNQTFSIMDIISASLHIVKAQTSVFADFLPGVNTHRKWQMSLWVPVVVGMIGCALDAAREGSQRPGGDGCASGVIAAKRRLMRFIDSRPSGWLLF
ncbi:MAG: hypothetical protein ACI4MG_02360 [Aristaeellaceae bacterium]